MEILVFGNSGRQAACRECLEKALSEYPACEITRIIVLPIPTTKDEKTVNGTDVTLSAAIESAGRGTLVAGYGIPEECAEKIENTGAVIYDALYDEALQEENAYLTALGASSSILTSEGRAPRDISLGIVGYGRIGREIAKIWFFLGGVPHIYSGRGEVVESLISAGMSASLYGEGMELSGLDILINTAPASIIKPDTRGISEVGRIIDLASGDYLYGIPRVEKMPSIPAAMYPESAGKLYADSIIRHLGGVK